MNENKISSMLYDRMSKILDNMKNHPESVSEEDKNLLSKLYSKICKPLGISEHCRWEVKWQVEKWLDTARKMAGFAPDEVVCDTQNIIVNGGATAILNLITGVSGTKAYNHENAKILVGSSSTGEDASDTTITGSDNEAQMEDTYPKVDSRQMVFRASFGDEKANFAWHEIGVTNGDTLMNRKVVDLGTKNQGTWTVQLTITLTSE